MSSRVVVFTANNARIVENVQDLGPYLEAANTVVNPDLTKVNKLPPHLWKKVGIEVHPMSAGEQAERLTQLGKSAPKNSPILRVFVTTTKAKVVWALIGSGITLGLVGLLYYVA